jgi:hypothetical protein
MRVESGGGPACSLTAWAQCRRRKQSDMGVQQQARTGRRSSMHTRGHGQARTGRRSSMRTRGPGKRSSKRGRAGVAACVRTARAGAAGTGVRMPCPNFFFSNMHESAYHCIKKGVSSMQVQRMAEAWDMNRYIVTATPMNSAGSGLPSQRKTP